MKEGKNYELCEVKAGPENEKIFIGKTLGLTGCEVSVNYFKPGKGYGFVHSHKRNEEVYIILKGKGVFYIDGKEFDVHEGNIIKVLPNAKRALSAKADSELSFLCIQADQNSLVQSTREDGIISENKASWM
jgi:mannose-6-phosphate isomerase-like protein (cupin superfamily)